MFSGLLPGGEASTIRERHWAAVQNAQQNLNLEGEPVETFEKLKKLIIEAEEDIKKAEGGNKAAGTRARQTMQDIKNAAQEVREKILELRNAGEPNK